MSDRRPRPAGAVVVALLGLVLGVLASSVVAQTQTATDPPVTDTVTTQDTGAQTGTTTTNGDTVTTGTATDTVDTGPQSRFVVPADLGSQERRAEQRASCDPERELPTSGMLGLRRGAVGGGQERSLLVLGLGALVLAAAVAFVVWRRSRWASADARASSGEAADGGPESPAAPSDAGGPPASAAGPRGRRPLLDTAGTAVAIGSGIVAIAAQFVPGIGVEERPPPHAAMEVRQVHARVQRGSYARAVQEPVPKRRLNRLEIGNVIWLEVDLAGYAGRQLELQWAEYNLDTGGALLDGTDRDRRLDVRHNAETRIEPVWVPYPASGRFQVQFRLLEGGRVRAMARTGEMKGLRYRYGCRELQR